MGLEDPNRFAALDQQRLLVAERPQRGHDAIESAPVASGLPRASVDHEILGAFGDFGIEVVHQHSQGGLLNPATAGEGGSTSSPHGRMRGHGLERSLQFRARRQAQAAVGELSIAPRDT
jgi:hypothetical protein